jgi:hypothetical protein
MLCPAAVWVDAMAEHERNPLGAVIAVGGEDQHILEQLLWLGEVPAETFGPGASASLAESVGE